MDVNLLSIVLMRCDLYLKLDGVTIEKSIRATLTESQTSVPDSGTGFKDLVTSLTVHVREVDSLFFSLDLFKFNLHFVMNY